MHYYYEESNYSFDTFSNLLDGKLGGEDHHQEITPKQILLLQSTFFIQNDIKHYIHVIQKIMSPTDRNILTVWIHQNGDKSIFMQDNNKLSLSISTRIHLTIIIV